MIRLRPSILLAGLLILAILIPQAIEANPCTLLPPSIISQQYFSQLLTAVRIGKIIYRMDAFERLSADCLRKELDFLSRDSGERIFDADCIDFMKKGFTRHYLLTINGKSLVMRICLTSELRLQPEIPDKDIVVKGEIESVKATYQVFDIIALTEVQKPQPRPTFHSIETERSS